MIPPDLASVAIRVSDRDNCAVAKVHVPAGTALRDGARDLTVTSEVEPGPRFALAAIPRGSHVVQYGQPIGTSRGLAPGDAITAETMSNDIPIVRDLPDDLVNPPPPYVPEDRIETFPGFLRPDGRTGTRNFLLVLPTSMCSSHEASQIATIAEFQHWSRERFPNVDGVVAIPHSKGCGCSDGSNLEITMRTLAHYADHPNVGGVLMLELGCEKTNQTMVDRWLGEHGGFGWDKPVERIGVQSEGGTEATILRGLSLVERMLPEVDRCARTPRPVSEIVLGLKCGGSDGFSGLSANPALGVATDMLVDRRGTAIITEVPEFCGAEHVFAWRARDAATGRAVYETVDWYKDHAAVFGTRLDDNPSPGNKAGGLLNITIKSLGALAKAGTRRVEGCCGYAETPSEPGLWLMQGPGYDQEATPGIVASGCNVVVFTTGRGTTIGNAICPVIKLSSNTETWQRMRHDIDLDAGTVISGTETIEECGRRVFEHVVAVAGGEPALAERTKHREFQIWSECSVSL
ncbi:MAG: UxaA family hydrolase [Planctomycetota bacterium]|nr:UxaA family hydrolase [Planctomycetota bacterium]